MAEIAAKSKRLDENHVYYVDWYDGYYFHTYAQARKYAIKCLVQWYLEHKKNPKKVSNEYRIRINRANEYKRTIQKGFTPYPEWYAVVTMEKVKDSFIIRDLPNHSTFTPKKTTLSMDKALDYARVQI